MIGKRHRKSMMQPHRFTDRNSCFDWCEEIELSVTEEGYPRFNRRQFWRDTKSVDRHYETNGGCDFLINGIDLIQHDQSETYPDVCISLFLEAYLINTVIFQLTDNNDRASAEKSLSPWRANGFSSLKARAGRRNIDQYKRSSAWHVASSDLQLHFGWRCALRSRE